MNFFLKLIDSPWTYLVLLVIILVIFYFINRANKNID